MNRNIIGSCDFSPSDNGIILLYLYRAYLHLHLTNLKQVSKNLDLVLHDEAE